MVSGAAHLVTWLSRTASLKNIWGVVRGGLKTGKGFTGKASRVAFGNWNNYGDDAHGSSIKAFKLLSALGYGVFAPSSAVYQYENGRSTFHDTGNRRGGTVWSWAQTALHGTGGAIGITGLLFRGGPTNWILRKIPVVPLLLSAAGLVMDYTQAISLMGMDHWLAKLGHAGMDNALMNYRSIDDPALGRRSVFYKPWIRMNIALDHWFFRNVVGIENYMRPFVFAGDRPESEWIRFNQASRSVGTG